MSEFPSTLKVVTVWLLVGTALFLGFQAFQAQQQGTRFVSDGGLIEIRRGSDGHYHWPGQINGAAVDFLVDTGATSTAMPMALADRLGLQSVGTVRSQTAGGVVTGQVMRADITLDGGVRATSLRVVALEGLGSRPLLGMDVLGRLQWRQSDGVLTIDLRGRSGASASDG
jgi:aspartyl protease family protein